MFMNRKGQALVEFVLILPVFLMILFTIVDFGILLYSKNELQNQSTDIIRMIQNKEELSTDSKLYSDINIQIEDYKEDYQKITLTKDIELITPFLDKFLGNPCEIEVERIIPNAE